MDLAYIENGPDDDVPEAGRSAELFVQFDTFDVSQDAFTIFWGGRRLDHPAALAEFFTESVHRLTFGSEARPIFKVALYTDRHKTVYRSAALNLNPPELEGNLWFARFELMPDGYKPSINEPKEARFIVWGRIGDNADAPSDSLGVWMFPADFKVIRSNVAKLIMGTFPRQLESGELEESLQTLARRIGVSD